MTDEPNPYQPPGEAMKPSAKPAGLGVLLVGFLVLQCLGNAASGVVFLFAPSIAHEKFPTDPEWSFPLRGGLGLLIVLACVLILRRRLIGLFAYVGVVLLAAVVNHTRGVSFWKTLLASAVPAILVALMVRRKLSLFS